MRNHNQDKYTYDIIYIMIKRGVFDMCILVRSISVRGIQINKAFSLCKEVANLLFQSDKRRESGSNMNE